MVKDIKVVNTNVQILLVQSDGRGLVISISNHYRGPGILNHKLIEFDAIIENLFYSGDKPPYMTWEKLKLMLNDAYLVAANHGEQHNNRDKLCKLLTKRI